MRIYLLFTHTLALCLIALVAQAQSIDRSVIATQGANFSNPIAGSIEWTLGESITETFDDCFLTQGFQQSFEISGCGFTSAEEVPLHPELMVFPNPTNHKVNVVLTEGKLNKVYIFDWQGKLILSKNSDTTSQDIIDVATLPTGQYIIRILSDNQIYNQSFTKID